MSKPMQESYDRMMDKYKHTNMRWIYSETGTVRIIHEEGSEFILQNAWLDEYSDEDYLWVVTEHVGEFIFAKNEVVFYSQCKKIKGHDVVWIEK